MPASTTFTPSTSTTLQQSSDLSPYTVAVTTINDDDNNIQRSSILCRWTRDNQPCGQEFQSPEQLFQHLVSSHIGRKIDGNLCLQCCWQDCKYQCSKRDHAISHCLTHIPEFRPYRCHLCQKSFARQPDLRKHVRTHDGKRNEFAEMPHEGERTDKSAGGESGGPLGRKRKKQQQFQVIHNLFGTIKQKKLKPEYNEEMAMQLDEIAKLIIPSASARASRPPLQRTVVPVPRPQLQSDDASAEAVEEASGDKKRFQIQSWLHYSTVPIEGRKSSGGNAKEPVSPSPTPPVNATITASPSGDMLDESIAMDLDDDDLLDWLGDNCMNDIAINSPIRAEIYGDNAARHSQGVQQEDLQEMNDFFTKLYAHVRQADEIDDTETVSDCNSWAVNSSPQVFTPSPPIEEESEMLVPAEQTRESAEEQTSVGQWIEQLKETLMTTPLIARMINLPPATSNGSHDNVNNRSNLDCTLSALSEIEVKEIVDDFFKDSAPADAEQMPPRPHVDSKVEQAKNARVSILIKGLEELSLLKDETARQQSPKSDEVSVKISRREGGRFPVLPLELRNAIAEAGANRKPLEPMNSDPISLIRVMQRKNRRPRPSILPPSSTGDNDIEGYSSGSGRVSPIFVQALTQKSDSIPMEAIKENQSPLVVYSPGKSSQPSFRPPMLHKHSGRPGAIALSRSVSQPVPCSTIPRMTKDARRRHIKVIETVMNQLDRIWDQMQSVSTTT